MELLPGERIDDLQLNGLHIIQNENGFRFGMDAVLLSDFTSVRPRERIADMGTGTVIIPLLLSQKRADATSEAFEIQPDVAEMASRSVKLNGLEERIRVHSMDMRSATDIIGYQSMHAVTCNPPYGKAGSALTSHTEAIKVSRHETEITIEDIVRSCSNVLRNMGRLTMVFPAQRMLELCDAMRRCRLEPKRIRMVCAKVEKAPYLVLVEAMKNAKPSLLWMPPLVVYHPDGTETEEIRRIYHKL